MCHPATQAQGPLDACMSYGSAKGLPTLVLLQVHRGPSQQAEEIPQGPCSGEPRAQRIGFNRKEMEAGKGPGRRGEGEK